MVGSDEVADAYPRRQALRLELLGPGRPWDKKPNGATRHWVGVDLNGGYYGVDVESVVSAYKHGLVFGQPEINV